MSPIKLTGRGGINLVQHVELLRRSRNLPYMLSLGVLPGLKVKVDRSWRVPLTNVVQAQSGAHSRLNKA